MDAKLRAGKERARREALTQERREQMTGRIVEALEEKRIEQGELLVMSSIIDEVDAAVVLEKVLKGRTLIQISEEMGVGYSRVKRVYRDALQAIAEQRAELGELVLQEHLQKVQKVMLAMQDDMENGSTRAAEMYLRALEQEARLLNLYPSAGREDAKQQVNIQVNFNGAAPQSDVVEGTVTRRLP